MSLVFTQAKDIESVKRFNKVYLQLSSRTLQEYTVIVKHNFIYLVVKDHCKRYTFTEKYSFSCLVVKDHCKRYALTVKYSFSFVDWQLQAIARVYFYNKVQNQFSCSIVKDHCKRYALTVKYNFSFVDRQLKAIS